MVERGGRSPPVVPSTPGTTMMSDIGARVVPGAVIYTDESTIYGKALPMAGYQHKRVHHSARVYVGGDAQTQTIEGFWSIVKRRIGGTHHAVSAKYLRAT